MHRMHSVASVGSETSLNDELASVGERLVYWSRRPRSLYRSLHVGTDRRKAFDKVEAFCIFIGYPRSGTTLIGSLLNAHPNIVIAQELSIFGLLYHGANRNQMYSLILDKDRDFSRQGRCWQGYEYNIASGWAGRYERLSVIGDKKGAVSTRWLQRHPQLLDRLRKMVGVKIRILHPIRNPYDNIATISKRHELTLEQSIDFYAKLCEANSTIAQRVNDDELLDVRLESVIADPRESLERMCAHLGVECIESYARHCEDVVFDSPRQTRHAVQWTAEQIRGVREVIGQNVYLDGYSFDS